MLLILQPVLGCICGCVTMFEGGVLDWTAPGLRVVLPVDQYLLSMCGLALMTLSRLLLRLFACACADTICFKASIVSSEVGPRSLLLATLLLYLLS